MKRLRSMGGEKPRDRALRLASVAYAGYDTAFGRQRRFARVEVADVFRQAFELGYMTAVDDLVEVSK